MSGIQSSKDSKRDELFDTLLHSLDQHFGLNKETLSIYEWLKAHVMGGRDFDFRGITKEQLVEHTKRIVKEIDGRSRNKLPCELADEEDVDGVDRPQ